MLFLRDDSGILKRFHWKHSLFLSLFQQGKARPRFSPTVTGYGGFASAVTPDSSSGWRKLNTVFACVLERVPLKGAARETREVSQCSHFGCSRVRSRHGGVIRIIEQVFMADALPDADTDTSDVGHRGPTETTRGPSIKSTSMALCSFSKTLNL